MSGEPVRWGFIAAGYIATTALGPAVQRAAGATLQAVASRDTSRAWKLEPEAVHESYQALVEDGSVEAVYISLTNDAHLQWIRAALAAGKHVLCEKPLTMNADECRDAFAAADAAGRLLVEAAWMRWHPRYQRAGELLADGASGVVRRIDATFTFDGVPESNYRRDGALGGGAILDLGPYVLAPAIDWCGDDWSSISAEATTNESQADLKTVATLSSPETKAQIITSIIDSEQQMLTVEADALTVTWDDQPFTSWREGAHLTISDDTTQWTEDFGPCDGYQLMVEAVSRRIRGDDAAFIPPRSSSVQTAELIDRIKSATVEVS